LQALARIYRSYPHLKVLCVGAGSIDQLLIQMNHTISDAITELIVHVPPMPNSELNPYYNSGDIGIWPAEASIAMIEACAAGLPIIVRAGDATAHRIKNANGLAFDGSVDSLAKCLEQLVGNNALRKEMGRRSRELVDRELSWARISERLLGLYGEA
jgi:glycosyltransferase involved in cell wall biosynthesis